MTCDVYIDPKSKIILSIVSKGTHSVVKGRYTKFTKEFDTIDDVKEAYEIGVVVGEEGSYDIEVQT